MFYITKISVVSSCLSDNKTSLNLSLLTISMSFVNLLISMFVHNTVTKRHRGSVYHFEIKKNKKKTRHSSYRVSAIRINQFSSAAEINDPKN